MNGGTKRNADHDVRPDLADNFLDVVPASLKATYPAHALALELRRRTSQDALYPVFKVTLHLQLADHQAGDDGHDQTQSKVERRHLPAEHAEEQHQRHFIDHRRRNKEGKGHAERHAGREKADEQRHRRAGAERGDDTEARGQHIADPDSLAGKHRPGALGREKSLDDTHHENNASQEQQHLGRVEEEKMHCLTEMGAVGEPEGSNYGIGKLGQVAVDR